MRLLIKCGLYTRLYGKCCFSVIWQHPLIDWDWCVHWWHPMQKIKNLPHTTQIGTYYHDGTIGAFLQTHQEGAKRSKAWRSISKHSCTHRILSTKVSVPLSEWLGGWLNAWEKNSVGHSRQAVPRPHLSSTKKSIALHRTTFNKIQRRFWNRTTQTLTSTKAPHKLPSAKRTTVSTSASCA